MMITTRRQRARLAILVMVALGAAMGCQVGPSSRASFFEECARPTPANEAWCLSVRFPNIE